MIKKEQTRRIYAMGARLGILESGNKNDMLHTLVFGLTKKESIRSLSDNEYQMVVRELSARLRNSEIKKRRAENTKGMMSDGQQRKVWQLMYQLEKLDEKPSDAKLGDRLCGIIRKEIHIDCISKQPFRWLTYQQGVKLIEILKKYIANAQRRKDGVGATN